MTRATTRRPRGRRGGSAHGDEEHGSNERWLVTYADMLTLLLVLFIVLYAMSAVDTTKFVELRAGLAAVFDPGQSAVANQSGTITSTDQGGSDAQQNVTPQLAPSPSSSTILDQQVTAAVQQDGRAQAEQQAQRVQAEVNSFKKIQATISTALAADGLTGSALFTIDQRGLVITVVTDKLVFGGNSATLLPGGQRILNVIGPTLVGLKNDIEVDGNTNQQNVSTYPYPSGWELSSARASSVVRYLISAFGVPASRLSAVGLSDQDPLYPASDPRSVTYNRRVDIVVLSTLSASDRALLPSVAGTVAK